MLKSEELAKLKSKAQYNDGSNEWSIPIFILKNREVALPSLAIKKQAGEFMETQKNDRVVVYEDEMSGGSGSALS